MALSFQRHVRYYCISSSLDTLKLHDVLLFQNQVSSMVELVVIKTTFQGLFCITKCVCSIWHAGLHWHQHCGYAVNTGKQNEQCCQLYPISQQNGQHLRCMVLELETNWPNCLTISNSSTFLQEPSQFMWKKRLVLPLNGAFFYLVFSSLNYDT